MTDQTKTTIWVSKSTAAQLRKAEEYPRQSYDDILRSLISYREVKERGVDPKLLAGSSKKG